MTAPRKSAKKANGKRLLVLDTNVLMHNPAALMLFQEHDIFIPAIVIEELNDHKGDREREIGKNSRQALRFMDELLNQTDPDVDIEEGIPLSLLSSVTLSSTEQTIAPTGLLYLQTNEVDLSESGFKKDIPDNQFLAVALDLKKRFPRQQVVVVSKDINVRIKARALKIPAEDYKNDQTIDDIKLLYSGKEELPANFWETATTEAAWHHGEFSYWNIVTPLAKEWKTNQFLYIDDGTDDSEFIVLQHEGEKAQIRTIVNYRKHKVWNILARNREQNFALNALMDPDIDFISLAGKAGSGKTLLSLAAAIGQVIEIKTYNKVIFTREQASLGKDMGFLPGTEEAKMAPWLGALYDNLEVLTDGAEKRKGHAETDNQMVKGKIGNPIMDQAISIKSLNFMQGRTLINKFFIIDETQNITAKQAKDLITRAGPGTKVIFCGNLAQVATPYLSGTSSGLAYVVDRMQRYDHGAHVTLVGTERSRLAEFAADNL